MQHTDEHTNSAAPTAPRGRARWVTWVGLIALLLLAAVAGLVFLRSDPQPAAEQEVPRNSAEVVRTDLTDETIYRGTLGTVADDALVAPVSGVVSLAPAAGDTIAAGTPIFAIDGEPVVLLTGSQAAHRRFQLSEDTRSLEARVAGTVTDVLGEGSFVEQGDVVARIDGEPVVALYGDVPMYRTLQDLSDNMTGDDVLQLEQALSDLGYNDNDVTIDGEFTQATEDMVERWQDDLGADDDGLVTVADVVFIPGPGQVVETLSSVGDRVGDGSPMLVIASGRPVQGPDVMQLEQALAELGFDAGGELILDGVYDEATGMAVAELQAAIGATADGLLGPGEVRFASAAVRVSNVDADVGTTVAAGTPVLTLSSADKVVSFDLPAADQDLVAVGDSVTVELPDGEEVPATVTHVAETATTSADQLSAVFEVEVALDDPTLAADLEQAPVDVAVTSDSVEGVIAVPVAALLALAEGGYAIEVIDADDSTRLVAVDPGFFASGLVELKGSPLQPGTRVVIP